jgi:hypothetical protein
MGRAGGIYENSEAAAPRETQSVPAVARIMALGLDPATGLPLVPAVAEESFARALLRAMPDRGGELTTLAMARSAGMRFRGLVERKPMLDLGDPLAAGWTYLVAAGDPRYAEIARILRPLAIKRGMANPGRPLLFGGQDADEWLDWMTDNFWSPSREPAQYILIVGGPDRVPFHFQAVLSSVASVGRLDFDSLAELQAYVEKILRLESESRPAVRRAALMFATDRGRPDATYYSRRFMAEPIVSHLADAGVPATALTGEQATAPALLTALTRQRPAVVYAAAHGAGRPRASAAEQRRLNGALVCDGGELVSAADIPDAPVAEGSVVLQFGCFSGGTPARSDYAHWLGGDRINAAEDFVAALPKRLLAHPRGPIAFIGHVDLAWLHAFDDPDAPDLNQAWHPRLAPFVSAVDSLLAPLPVGLALRAMNKRYDVGNAQLATAFDRQKRGTLPDSPAAFGKLVRAFITRSDAQNYLVLGDPAVYPRMWEP